MQIPEHSKGNPFAQNTPQRKPTTNQQTDPKKAPPNLNWAGPDHRGWPKAECGERRAAAQLTEPNIHEAVILKVLEVLG